MLTYEAWLSAFAEKMNSFEGWVDPAIFGLLPVVSRALSQHHGLGGICEIGVHHGKFFMALNGLLDDPAIPAVAIDLFDSGQHMNIDGSGNGNLAIFQDNLRKFDRHNGRNVTCVSADSTTLTPDQLPIRDGYRIISIDGGHTAEHTISDLHFAERALHPCGLLFVDDFLNSHWLGVIDGVTQYLRARPTTWPLAFGHNKLLMCRMSMYPSYFQFFRENYTFARTTKLCGYEFLTV